MPVSTAAVTVSIQSVLSELDSDMLLLCQIASSHMCYTHQPVLALSLTVALN
jgi:hypothetical protein